jgi:uncharacterized membrane protein
MAKDRPHTPASHPPQPPTAATPSRLMAATQVQQFQGPLPHPDLLRQYNDIVPGAAERIIALAERQAEHRMTLEKIVIHGDTVRAHWGLVCGLVISLALLGSAIYMAAIGYAWPGAILGAFDIVALAGVFVYGTHSRREERAERVKGAQHTTGK